MDPADGGGRLHPLQVGDDPDVHGVRPAQQIPGGEVLRVQGRGDQDLFRVLPAEALGNGVELVQLLIADLSVFAGDKDRGHLVHQDQVDLGRLNISYMFESITAKPSVHEALYGIMYNAYLLRPYRNFWLCLRDDWLDTEHTWKEGYPEIMRNVLHAIPQNSELPEQTQHCGDSPMYNFKTKDLIPDFPENQDTPSVFYFTPVHFQDNTLGYAVLECDLAQKQTIGSVYHLWLRNVSNALEMKRLQVRGERAAGKLAKIQETQAASDSAET